MSSGSRRDLMADVQLGGNFQINNGKMQNDGPSPSADRFNNRSRSRSPVVRRSRSRSRSPRDWKRTERSDRERDRDRTDRGDRTRRDSSRARGSDRPAVPVSSKRLFISNIPYQLRWQDLKDLFRDKVGEVTYVELYEGPDGKSLGAGIIEFKDVGTAQKAVDVMHQHEIDGRRIIVREERDRDRRRMEAQVRAASDMDGGDMSGGMGGGSNMGGGMGGNIGGGMGNNMGGSLMGGVGSSLMEGMMGGNSSSSTFDTINNSGGGMMGGSANDYGIPAQVLQQLGIDGPITNQVFVANLDYTVTYKKLMDVFSLAGQVIKAEIKEDKEGKSRGLGIVQFETPVEAIQAISMFNGQVLYDRTMTVRIDKMSEAQPAVPSRLPSGLKTIGLGLGAGGAPLKNLAQMPASVGNMMGNSSMGGGMGMGMSGGSGGMNSLMGSGMGGSMGGGMGGSMSGMVGNMGGMGGNMGGMGSNMSGSMGGGFNDMGMSSNSMGGGMSGMGSGMSGGFGTSSSSSMGGNMGMGNMNQMGNMGGMGDGGMGGGGMGGGRSMHSNQRTMDLGSMGNMGGMSSLGGSGLGSNMGRSMNTMSLNMGNSSSLGSRSNMGSSRGTGSSNMDDPTSVFVRNLPYTYNWKDLKDRFSGVGDVKYAAIKMENGKSKGVGIVRFGSNDEARRAVHMMNGARIDGREIIVRVEST